MTFGLVLLVISSVLMVLGILILRGNVDLLRTYHRNQDYSKEAYRKAVGICFVFAAAVLLSAGIGAFFLEAALQVLILAPAILVSVLPLWFVLRKFNR